MEVLGSALWVPEDHSMFVFTLELEGGAGGGMASK